MSTSDGGGRRTKSYGVTHGQAAELPVLGPWHRGTVPYQANQLVPKGNHISFDMRPEGRLGHLHYCPLSNWCVIKGTLKEKYNKW